MVIAYVEAIMLMLSVSIMLIRTPTPSDLDLMDSSRILMLSVSIVLISAVWVRVRNTLFFTCHVMGGKVGPSAGHTAYCVLPPFPLRHEHRVRFARA